MPAVIQIHAVPPWRSVDALDVGALAARLPVTPEQDIEVCLGCEYCAAACDRCDGAGNLRREQIGRPRKEIDPDRLREMLQLRLCNREMCAALGVSKRTLNRAKKQLAG